MCDVGNVGWRRRSNEPLDEKAAAGEMPGRPVQPRTAVLRAEQTSLVVGRQMGVGCFANHECELLARGILLAMQIDQLQHAGSKRVGLIAVERAGTKAKVLVAVMMILSDRRNERALHTSR